MSQRLQAPARAVRTLPFPYRGAAALSSDAEYFSLELFEELMRFMNTRGPTRFGLGLGLEVTASMFFYSDRSEHLSYFAGDDRQARRGPEATRLEDYLRGGWIDTNHSFGAFGPGTSGNPFTRGHAERIYELLAGIGVTLPVFTNHGGNPSNLGGHVPFHEGDVRGSAAYHADLLTPHGVEFAWLDDRRLSAERVPVRGARARVVRDARRVARALRDRDQRPGPRRRLLGRVELRDGTRMTAFTRLRSTGYDAPNLSSLPTQLRAVDLPRLYREAGAVAIYQHLGVLERRGGRCTAATVDAVRRRPEVYLAPLRALADEADKGQLWVCGTARLLRYARMARSVDVRFDPGASLYTITATDPQVDPGSLEGLTFYIDPSLPVQASFGDRSVPVVVNGPDQTGRPSATVPITPLPAVW